MPLLLANVMSAPDWMIIAVLALVFFGGNKIPELARGIGEGIRELKHGMEGTQRPTANVNAEGKTVSDPQK